MKSAIAIGMIVAAGGIALVARGQQTARPGEPTQARVFIENRNPNEAVPVAVESIAGVLYVRLAGLDPNVVLPTKSTRQNWEYRVQQLAPDARAGALADVGNEGWEAVGVLQSGAAGATVLLKRPR